MRRIDALLDRYGQSHRHPVNKAIHWVCVPLITWCVLAFFWSASPAAACAAIALAVAYYFTLSPPLAVGMLGVTAVLAYPLALLGPRLPAVAAVVFVAAWIGQFAGHRIEGRRPSFVEDVRFLLIGPVWLLADVYRRAGIRY